LVAEANNLSENVALSIMDIWENQKIKVFIEKYFNELQIPSSYGHFFDNVDRIASDDYLPTTEDILNAKLRTTGITETKFTEGNASYTIVDVGGQRSERRKWMQCFDNVSAIIYFTALDEYNRILLEDNSTNRLEESLSLFGEVTSSEYLVSRDIILFLNKSDIFKQKIESEPLSAVFSDIDPDEEADFDSGVLYIEGLYNDAYRGEGKIHTFTTCVLDTDTVDELFKRIMELISSQKNNFQL